MTTLGDVWAIIATLSGLFITVWSLIIGMAMMFKNQSDRGAVALRANPWKMIFMGVGIFLPTSILGVIMINLHVPPLTLLGWMMILTMLAIAAIGAGSVASIAAARIQEMDPKASEYQVLCRASLLIVGSSFVPVLGWMLIGPAILFAAIGSGVSALFAGEKVQNNVAI